MTPTERSEAARETVRARWDADAELAREYRISDVHTATVNGRRCKIFTAHKRRGDAFVQIGQFSAPARTAAQNLWRVARDAGN
jgi:hypothetical protein